MDPSHTVSNQPPPLVDYNLFSSDPVLTTALSTQGVGPDDSLLAFGGRVGSHEVIQWGFDANENEPQLRTHDRFGNRIDRVDFHPAWHALIDQAVSHGLHALPWEPATPHGAHVRRAAATFMVSQIEAGHFCPMSMTNSVVPALQTTPEVADEWIPRIVSRSYDPSFQPAPHKTGVLMGMGMTEKQGGSDVRKNTTRAVPVNGGGPAGEYRITGHKWFTSAPMSDAFLILAQAPGGLSCFLLPRWTPDRTQNPFLVQRLKDKLGNRSNASCEVEFVDSYAVLVGEEGRGVQTIIEMVNGTRLDCVIGSAALMRQAVSQAAWHTHHRAAFGAKLDEQPLMRNVIADLEIEAESATLMMVRLAGAFDRSADDPAEAAMKRIALPIAKYWVTKRASEVVREALECLGGNGYVEESIMPRLYRETPVNAIWEGSGNVIALDVLRAARRSPDTLDVFITEISRSKGVDRHLDDAIRRASLSIDAGTDSEFGARRIVENLAVAWTGALLTEHGNDDVFGAFVSSRLSDRHGALYGTLPSTVGADQLVTRSLPV